MLEVQLRDELGKGDFHGSFFVLARLPNFFGFSPSSRALSSLAPYSP